jgi:hypothetical protein
VGRPGAPIAGALLARVGELVAAFEDARDDDDGAGPAYNLHSAVNATIGVALSDLGAEAVLAVLPLNLNKQVGSSLLPFVLFCICNADRTREGGKSGCLGMVLAVAFSMVSIYYCFSSFVMPALLEPLS